MCKPLEWYRPDGIPRSAGQLLRVTAYPPINKYFYELVGVICLQMPALNHKDEENKVWEKRRVMILLRVVAGIALFVTGRNLFWLFVGLIGFTAGIRAATTFLLRTRPPSLLLCNDKL